MWKLLKRKFSLVVAITAIVALLASTSGVYAQNDGSESVVKRIERSYEIAVVFDNSGSMYNKTDLWCKAKYAMEVFAAMTVNDEDDSSSINRNTLKIYPMWPVKTKGESSGTDDPIEINSIDDIDKIHEMVTLQRGETPFEPVRDAVKDLKNSGADEKWLVVLTDGEFNKDKRDGQLKKGAVDVEKQLNKFTKEGIKVEYIALGDEAKALKGNQAAGLYTTKSTSETINEDLIANCNYIFQRVELPSDYINDNGKLKFDISMNKTVIFVQGKGASVKEMSNVETLSKTKCSYSSKSTEGKYKETAEVDKSLNGEVTTFGSCKRGVYSLKLKNVDTQDMHIYYEPDVNIKVTLRDANDNGAKEVELTNSDGFKTGDYLINYMLIDNRTDKEIKNNKLLGNVKYEAKLISNGKEKILKQNSPFHMSPDGQAFVDVKATYLERYVISTSAMKDAYTIKVNKAAAKDMKVKLDVKQKGGWYQLKKHEEWKPVRADLEYDGRKMTDNELERVKVSCSFGDENIAYRTEPVLGRSAVDIYLGQDENGKYVEPPKGKYKMDVEASYTAKDSKASVDEDNEKVRISSWGRLMYLLSRIIPILLLLAFLLWWNLRKSFPRKVYFKDKMGHSLLKVRTKGLNLSSNSYPGELSCDAVKVTSHISRKKKNAKFVIKNLRPDAGVQSFTIGYGNEYTKDNSGGFVDSFGTPLEPGTKFTISNGTELVWKKKGKTRKGTITINNKN